MVQSVDWQKLRERVTEEVLRQLHAEPPQAAPPPAPPPQAEAPVVHEVLLVIAPGVEASALDQVRQLALEGVRMTALVEPGLDPKPAQQAVGIGRGNVIQGGSPDLAARARLVAFPVLPGKAESPVLERALAAKRPVVACREGPDLDPRTAASQGMQWQLGQTLWSVRRQMEQYYGEVQKKGVRLVPQNRFAFEVGRALKSAPPPAAPPPPAPAPAPAVQTVDREMARYIDHTLLKPEATKKQIQKLCQEAVEYGFHSVCVNSGYVKYAAELVRGTPVKVCAVVGFPLGAASSTAKAMEARDAIANGAAEIDMVINVGALKSGEYDCVLNDIKAVADACRGRALLKVILETALLNDEEKVKACQLAKQAGADFVKTSTGFSSGGATVQDIRLMRQAVGPEMGVKASGGIRDYQAAKAMIEAGATRIGASASVAIVTGSGGGADKY